MVGSRGPVRASPLGPNPVGPLSAGPAGVEVSAAHCPSCGASWTYGEWHESDCGVDVGTTMVLRVRPGTFYGLTPVAQGWTLEIDDRPSHTRYESQDEARAAADEIGARAVRDDRRSGYIVEA